MLEKSRRPRVAQWATNPNKAPQKAPMTMPPRMTASHSVPTVKSPRIRPMSSPTPDR